MAPNIRVPEGFVFVPRRRGENVAAALMEAADAANEDRHTSVRSVSGGYHVLASVAEAYGIEQPEVDDAAVTDAEAQAGAGETVDQTNAATINDGARAGSSEQVGGETGQVDATVGETAESTPAEFPDGDPTGDWTVKQLEAWADSRNPKVDLGSGDKASKVQAALDSLKS